MKELTEGKTESQVSKEDAQELKKQAEFFRQLRASAQDRFSEPPLAAWRKFFYLFLIFLVLFSAVFLLIAQKTRRQLIASVGERWVELYGGKQNEIFKLPPPPPQAVKSRVAVPALSLPSGDAPEEPSGVLFLDQQPFSTGQVEVRPPVPVRPVKTAANEEAYNRLRETSEDIRELVDGAVPEFEFKDWQPVKNNAPEFWIDLLLTGRADGQEVHMVWSINMETGRTTALSQAARDWLASRREDQNTSRQ